MVPPIRGSYGLTPMSMEAEPRLRLLCTKSPVTNITAPNRLPIVIMTINFVPTGDFSSFFVTILLVLEDFMVEFEIFGG